MLQTLAATKSLKVAVLSSPSANVLVKLEAAAPSECCCTHTTLLCSIHLYSLQCSPVLGWCRRRALHKGTFPIIVIMHLVVSAYPARHIHSIIRSTPSYDNQLSVWRERPDRASLSRTKICYVVPHSFWTK